MPNFTPSNATIPPDIPDHTGNTRAEDRVFFVPPPPEIGKLLSAESSLKIGMKPMSWLQRLLLAAAITFGLLFVLAAIVFMAGKSNPNPQEPPLLNAIGLSACISVPLGGLVLGLVAYFSRFKVMCSYVGELGATRYIQRGSLNSSPTVQLLDFRRAAELRTSQTRQFYNGIYTGTTYTFRWTDNAGSQILNISGTYQAKDGNPKPGDPFHFAAITEIAWSNYFLNTRADEELSKNGSLRFNLDKKKWVILGPGFIEFHFGAEPVRCDAADIKSITLGQGTFSIHHRDAKWYSFKGKFSFPYANLGNARLFLFAIDRFLPPSTWAASNA